MNFIGIALKQVKSNENLSSVKTENTNAEYKEASIFGGGFFENEAQISNEKLPREFGGFF